jgi:hypothetical protein
MENSFYFILNPLNFEDENPFELIPGYFLKKPDASQLALIAGKLNGFSMLSHWPPFHHLGYNCDWVPHHNPDGKSAGSKLEKLPAEQWRYWIIGFKGERPHQISDDSDIGKIQCSVNLLQKDLDIGFGFLYAPAPYGSAFTLRNNQTFTFLEAHKVSNEAVAVTTNELKEVSAIYSLLKKTEQNHSPIYRLAQRFSESKSLPRQSDMITLGCFSVIEALVAHDPNPKEEYDSLNHQISTKMTLLSKRFERQLDYEGNFGQMDREKIWKQLYSYRSALAHGASAEFKTKFKNLKSLSCVLSFLKEATKLTLLFAMKEPEFLADLKKC